MNIKKKTAVIMAMALCAASTVIPVSADEIAPVETAAAVDAPVAVSEEAPVVDAAVAVSEEAPVVDAAVAVAETTTVAETAVVEGTTVVEETAVAAAAETAVVEETAATVAAETAAVEETTIAETAAVEETTMTGKDAEATVEPELWETLYAEVIAAYSTDEDAEMYMFDLIDMDADGIPELFISTGNYHMAGVDIYTIYEGNVVYVGQYDETTGETYGYSYGEYGEVAVAPEDNLVLDYYMGMGYEYQDYLTKQDDVFVSVLWAYNNEGAVEDPADIVYQINDEIVSKEDYDLALSQFDGINWTMAGMEFELNNTENLGKLAKDRADEIAEANAPKTDKKDSDSTETKKETASPDTGDSGIAGAFAAIAASAAAVFCLRKRK